MAQFPKVWEQDEAERIAQLAGEKLIERSVLRVFCKDCGKHIMWVAWVRAPVEQNGPSTWRPLVLSRAKDDRLGGERRTDRGFEFSWLDRGPVERPRCNAGRYVPRSDDLVGHLPPPTAKKPHRIKVSHADMDPVTVSR